MTSDETKSYIGQRLQELGLALQLDDGGYEKIHRFTNGTESGINQLCFKLVSLTSENDEHEVTTERVTKAIDELARIDEMMKRAGKADVPLVNEEFERTSIDQLAAVLEANAAVVGAASQTYAPAKPTRGNGRTSTKRASAEQRPKILVVNEAKTTRSIVVNALTTDFDCIETTDPDDAWRRLVHQTDIDLVITDVRAHERAHYDLISRIRSASAPAHLIGIPIIAMATTEEASAKQRALMAGANDVIAMNTDAGELKARVQARYKASRIQPQYGASSAKGGVERPPERKNGAGSATARSSPRPVAPARAERPPFDPARIEGVRRPFLNTADVMRHVPVGPNRFLARLYQVSSTTTVTLSATVLVIVLLVVIMYVNRAGDPVPPARVGPVAAAPVAPVETPKHTPERSSSDAPTAPSAATPNSSTAPPPASAETPMPPPASPTERALAEAKKSPKDQTASNLNREFRAREDATKTPGLDSSAKTEVRPSLPPPQLPRAAGNDTTTEPATAPNGSVAAREAELNQAATTKPAPERLTKDDLATLLKRFAYVYEAGDIEQFMNLFAANARTNDRMNRDGIRQDYETLFRTTDLRQFKLSHINWEVDTNQAHGWGNFEVTVRRAGDQELHNYSGSVTLYIERVDGRPRIVRLYHGQRRAGS